jgi:lipoprotein-releasing system ATP-binding protein
MIRVTGLEKEYQTGDGTVKVLRGIDLVIGKGERLAVVGASGAGKTTLMHILGGLDRPTTGQVSYCEKNIFQLKGGALDNFRNQTVGFVFQFHQLLPEFDALENVMMPALIAGQTPVEAAKLAGELLHEVGLGHRLTHKPGQLSGGEQQRVAIARALVMSPDVLLADEPTGNLDSRTSDGIYQLLQQLHSRYGLTMVIVTHSERFAARLDRAVHMKDGLLVG